MPNIITKCFYFCACFFLLSCSLSFALFLFCFYWIGHSRLLSLAWNAISFEIGSQKLGKYWWLSKNGDFFPLPFPVHSFESAKKTSSFFWKCKINEMCFVGRYFFCVRFFPKLSVLVNEYQYLYLCDTWQCKTLDTLTYSVWHSKNAQFCFLLPLPPPLLLMCHPLAFFPQLLCVLFSYVRVRRHEYPLLNSSTFFAFRPTVTGQFDRVFVCGCSLSFYFFCASRLRWPIVPSLIHSGRELSPLLIVTFIRIRSADCTRRIMFVELICWAPFRRICDFLFARAADHWKLPEFRHNSHWRQDEKFFLSDMDCSDKAEPNQTKTDVDAHCAHFWINSIFSNRHSHWSQLNFYFCTPYRGNLSTFHSIWLPWTAKWCF